MNKQKPVRMKVDLEKLEKERSAAVSLQSKRTISTSHLDMGVSWQGQPNGTTCCFPVALMNACLYMGKQPPDLEVLISLARCEHGGTINHEAPIRCCGLPLVRAHCEEVMNGAGVLRILHPKYNFHAVFVVGNADKVWMINSLLTDELVLKLRVQDIPLPRWEHQRHAWLLEDISCKI